MTLRSFMLPIAAIVLASCAGSGETGPAARPAGEPQTTKTGVLEAGATALQRDAPPDALDIYLVGFHPMKKAPHHQSEAHHFCRQVNQDLAQCALFDGNTAEANLTGIEYIISERLFATLPRAEKHYWHPHNGEIFSGQLVAPGLPAAAEKELMRDKMNQLRQDMAHLEHLARGRGRRSAAARRTGAGLVVQQVRRSEPGAGCRARPADGNRYGAGAAATSGLSAARTSPSGRGYPQGCVRPAYPANRWRRRSKERPLVVGRSKCFLAGGAAPI